MLLVPKYTFNYCNTGLDKRLLVPLNATKMYQESSYLHSGLETLKQCDQHKAESPPSAQMH